MYSPKIKDDLIPGLYKLAKDKGLPMTKVVDKILRDALNGNGLNKNKARKNEVKS